MKYVSANILALTYPIAERTKKRMPCKKFATLRLFVEIMPICKAEASGNGNIEFYRESRMFKFKITPDRHNAIQNLNYYDLPDPRHFSLPSTFKDSKM